MRPWPAVKSGDRPFPAILPASHWIGAGIAALQLACLALIVAALDWCGGPRGEVARRGRRGPGHRASLTPAEISKECRTSSEANPSHIKRVSARTTSVVGGSCGRFSLVGGYLLALMIAKDRQHVFPSAS